LIASATVHFTHSQRHSLPFVRASTARLPSLSKAIDDSNPLEKLKTSSLLTASRLLTLIDGNQRWNHCRNGHQLFHVNRRGLNLYTLSYRSPANDSPRSGSYPINQAKARIGGNYALTCLTLIAQSEGWGWRLCRRGRSKTKANR